jgi:hypothetical protein
MSALYVGKIGQGKEKYLHMHTISTSSIHVAVCVAMNAIWQADIRVGKQLLILQSLAIRSNIIAVNRRRHSQVILVRERVNSRIGNVHMLEIRRKLNTIGGNSIIGNCLHHTGLGLKAVGLVLDNRCRTEVLPVAVGDVCEPEIAGYGVLSDIVDGGEVAAEEVVDEDFTLVGCRVYEGQSSRSSEVALVAEDDLLAFAAVHWRTDWVPCSASIGFSQMLIAVR